MTDIHNEDLNNEVLYAAVADIEEEHDEEYVDFFRPILHDEIEMETFLSGSDLLIN